MKKFAVALLIGSMGIWATQSFAQTATPSCNVYAGSDFVCGSVPGKCTKATYQALLKLYGGNL